MSFVYEKGGGAFDLGGWEREGESGMFPSPLKIIRGEIEREKMEMEIGGRARGPVSMERVEQGGGEKEEEVFYSDYEDEEVVDERGRKERAVGRGEERYIGSEYEPGQDDVDAYLQDNLFSQPRAEGLPKLEVKEGWIREQQIISMESKGNVVEQEEETIYSDSEYETDYRDSD